MNFSKLSKDKIRRQIEIGEDFVQSEIQGEFIFEDIRDWWKSYLSTEQKVSVTPWRNPSEDDRPITVAELFSGPGGLAQGVKKFCLDIGVPFESITALDLDRDALRVYERNHQTSVPVSVNDWESHKGDVKQLLEGEKWKKPTITYAEINTHEKLGQEIGSRSDLEDIQERHRSDISNWKDMIKGKDKDERKKIESLRPTWSVTKIDAKYDEQPRINDKGPWRDIKPGDIDLLLAGPPCQGHSNLNNKTRRDDTKNELYLIVPAVAAAWNIPLVIIENVEGVIHDVEGVVQQTEGLFKSMGYKVEKGVLNAAKMGWPQTRKRFFLIARKNKPPISIDEVMELFSIPESKDPLGIESAIKCLEEKAIRRTKGTVLNLENFMYSHPDYSPKEQARLDFHKAKQKAKKLEAVDKLKEIFEQEGEVDKHQIESNFASIREKIEATPIKELKKAKNLPNQLHNKTHWRETSYPTVYGRLVWEEPSGTITSGYMCSGRGRFTHPEKARTLTPAEAALLQGFPSSYEWTPEDGRIPNITSLAQWIGDAVPMPLGYAAAYSALGNGLDFK